MTEQDFLNQIEVEPHNDVLKLVYADWLDEQGNPLGQAIRLACELRRLIDENKFTGEQLNLLNLRYLCIDPRKSVRVFSALADAQAEFIVRGAPGFHQDVEEIDKGGRIERRPRGNPYMILHLERV